MSKNNGNNFDKNQINNKDNSLENTSSNWAPYLVTLGICTYGGYIIGSTNNKIASKASTSAIVSAASSFLPIVSNIIVTSTIYTIVEISSYVINLIYSPSMHGALIGLASSIADEYLIDNNYYSHHYIAPTIFWGGILKNTFPSNKLGYVLLTSVSAAITYFGDDFLNFKQRIDTSLGAILTLNRLFDKNEVISTKELNKIYNEAQEDPYKALQTIKNDVGEIYNNSLIMTFLKVNLINIGLSLFNVALIPKINLFAHGSFIINLITHNNDKTFNELFFHKIFSNYEVTNPKTKLFIYGSEILLTLALKETINFYSNTLTTSYDQKQIKIVMDKGLDLILANGNGVKINSAPGGENIIKSFNYDLNNLYLNGAKLNSLVKNNIDYLNHFSAFANMKMVGKNNIEISGFEMILPYILIPIYQILKNPIIKMAEIAKELVPLELSIWNIFNDIKDSINVITLREGEDFVNFNRKLVTSKRSKLFAKNEYLAKQKVLINNFYGISKQYIDMLSLGYYCIDGKISLKEAASFKSYLDGFLPFFIAKVNYVNDNKFAILAEERIKSLFNIIAVNEENNLVRTFNDEGKIIFTNYSLKLGNREIVQIDNLEFLPGKYYAITGKAGESKTITLLNLKMETSKPFTSKGIISTHQNAKSMFINQEVYFPKESTLLEAIYFPRILLKLTQDEQHQIRSQVISLIKELRISKFMKEDNESINQILDSIKFTLSGGEAGLISIIQAILYQPTHLFMDETFRGFDKESVILAERAILKYLPDTTILAVDHHAPENNINNYYDGGDVHFYNSRVEVRNIESISNNKTFETIENHNLSGICIYNTFYCGAEN